MYVHTLLYNACSATPFKVHGHCHVRETQILKQRNQRSACSDCGNIHYSKMSCANAAAKAAGKPKADKRTKAGNSSFQSVISHSRSSAPRTHSNEFDIEFVGEDDDTMPDEMDPMLDFDDEIIDNNPVVGFSRKYSLI